MKAQKIDYKANFFKHFEPAFEPEIIEYGWRMVNGLGLYYTIGETDIFDYAFEKMNLRSLYKKSGWEWNLDKF